MRQQITAQQITDNHSSEMILTLAHHTVILLKSHPHHSTLQRALCAFGMTLDDKSVAATVEKNTEDRTLRDIKQTQAHSRFRINKCSMNE